MKLILKNIFALNTLILISVVIILFTQLISIKKVKNYSILDLGNANLIILNKISPTSDNYKKIDINNDKKITQEDAEIIRQMLLGNCDYYIVFGDYNIKMSIYN